MKKEKRIGDRLVHEAPDWGTPPPPPVEDEVVPEAEEERYAATPRTDCSDHPGRENHCYSGACGACWLCTTKMGPTVRLGAEHPWVPEAPEPQPFVPAPGWADGAFGQATAASLSRLHEELRREQKIRDRLSAPGPSPLSRLLARIGRARYPEELRYQPIGPFAPGGVLDGPTIPELSPSTLDALEALMPRDTQLDTPDETDLSAYAEVSDSLIAALNEATRATPRQGYSTRVVRDSWAAPAEPEDGPHEHTWIDERELASTWVRRFCPGCGADESYDDTPEEFDPAAEGF